jgi:hypothetical protein
MQLSHYHPKVFQRGLSQYLLHHSPCQILLDFMNVGIHVGHLMGIHTMNTWGKGAGGQFYGLNGSQNQPLPLDFVTYFSFFLKNLPSFY